MQARPGTNANKGADTYIPVRETLNAGGKELAWGQITLSTVALKTALSKTPKAAHPVCDERGSDKGRWTPATHTCISFRALHQNLEGACVRAWLVNEGTGTYVRARARIISFGCISLDIWREHANLMVCIWRRCPSLYTMRWYCKSSRRLSNPQRYRTKRVPQLQAL